MAQSYSQGNQDLTEDEIVLRRIFPAEVWNMVLTKCYSESSNTLCSTSAWFKNWLLPRRTVYLFPQVWSLVKNTYIKIHDHLGKSYMDNFQNNLAFMQNIWQFQAQPRLQPSFTRSLTRINNSTLKFRLVCKGWRDAIDSVNLKEIDKIKTNPMKISRVQDIQKWVYKQETEISPTFNFEKFEQLVLGTNCGKVSNFVRAIVITAWSAEVFSLLEHIGKHVWYCTIKTDDSLHSKDVIYLNIRNTLILLPNLKTLEIDTENVPSGRNPGPVFDNQLPKTVAENPVKRLEKLNILVTRNLPTPIFKEMIRSNSHIKTLHVVRTISCGEYDICAVPLPNLVELSFRIFTNAELEALCQACVTIWKMAKLFLIVEMNSALNRNKLKELCGKILKNNYITLMVFDQKLEGLGSEVAENFEELRPRWR